jgi:hypothetical protein
MTEWFIPSIVQFQASGERVPARRPATLVLAAYVRAEQVRTFNHRLQRRLALLAVVWLLVAGVTGLATPRVLAGGLTPLAATAVWSILTARRAIRRLHTLLASSHP